MRLLPAVLRQQLPTQFEIFVGRFRSQGVEGLIAGVIVDVRQQIGSLGVRVFLTAQIEVRGDDEQVFHLFHSEVLFAGGGQETVADLPVHVAAPLWLDGG